MQIGSPGRECNGCSILFIRKINEPVMVNQAKLFPSNYTNRVVHLCTDLPQDVVDICSNYSIFLVMFLL